MSDISIRLDGLLLALALAVGTLVFAAIALIALLRIWLSAEKRDRLAELVRASGGLALAHAVGVLALLGFLEQRGTAVTGVDWIDLLALPWLILFVVCLVLLFRGGKRTDR